MAENTTFSVEYNLGDLVKSIHDLGSIVKTAVVIGTAAILVGGVISWYLITTALETNRTIGKLEGERSVVVILEEMQKTLKDLSVEKTVPKVEPLPEKQGSLENLPLQIGRWTGVKADTTNELAEALSKNPKTTGPYWVYTDDPAAAEALMKAMKP